MLRALFLCLLAPSLLAQTYTERSREAVVRAIRTEGVVREAMRELGEEKKSILEPAIEVLRKIEVADAALVDPMQPSASLDTAWKEIHEARELIGPNSRLRIGFSRVIAELESARRSPMTADLGRIRSLIQGELKRPASREVVENVERLQDEILAWIKVQDLITAHLKTLSEAAGASLKASTAKAR